jgi:hypothetical protein
MTRLTALPLAAILACTFDGTGLISAGPPDAASTSSTGPGSTGDGPTTTDGPTTSTTTVPDTTTTSTTDPLTSTNSTTEGSTGLTATTGGPTCGDGVQAGDEACDGADLADQTCATLGFPGGTLACDPACAFDFTGCDPIPTCGNMQVDPGEDCDDVPTTTCVDLGYVSGDLACTNCAHDTSGCVGVPDDWYDANYQKRRKLTITKDKITGVHADFPVVLAITDMAIISSLGNKNRLVFATPDKQVLSHELELNETGRLIVWIELDLDAAADEVFYVYFSPVVPPADTEKPADTWSNGFLGVWHLDEDLPDEQETGKHPDSTLSGHDGTQHDNEGVDGDCKIGPCQQIGDKDWIDFAKANEFKLGNADATIALWFKHNDFSKKACSLFAKSDEAMSSDSHMILGALGDGKLSFEQIGGGKLDSDKDVLDGQWHLVAWTQEKDADGSAERWRLYVDGVEVKTDLFSGKNAADPHTARLGGPTAGSTFPNDCLGRYDELQVSTQLRDAGWMTTSFTNQANPTTFVGVGAEESLI